MTMNFNGITVEPRSVAGLGTCIQLPAPINAAFDMGICYEGAHKCDTVLITHGHMDHIAGIAMHCGRRALYKLPPPTYIVGKENAEALHDLFDAYRRLDKTELPCEIVVLNPGEEHRLNKGYSVKPVRAYHRVPTQGYVIYRTRKGLRADLQGKDQKEIRELALAGEEVTETVKTPEVAFTGDSLIDIVDREEDVRKAKLLCIEVTYFEDGYDRPIDVTEARRRGHIHLDEIAARADSFENEHILLTHFSPRYNPKDIVKAVEGLPEVLSGRVTPLIDRVP